MVKLPYLIGGFVLLQIIFFAAATAYNLRENSQIREETRKIVEAESLAATTATINQTFSKAEAARANVRLCASKEKRYDPVAGNCSP